jgi:peptidylprolyl isomerase
MKKLSLWHLSFLIYTAVILTGCGSDHKKDAFKPASAVLPAAGTTVAQSAEPQDPSEPVGEVFGEKITRERFNFIRRTAEIFSLSGKELKNENEYRYEAWKNLILLKEAENRKIEVPREEIMAEAVRLLAEKKIDYGGAAYEKFVEDNFGEDSKTFESRIGDLLRIKKLVYRIMNPPPAKITKEDAYQKFLNQYNSMNYEFVRFPTLEEASAFYKSMTPKKWDEAKAKDPKFSTPTGHISLEAIIDLWKVTKADAYRVHAMKIGDIAAPAAMVKGYGVFRLREKKNADPKEYNDTKEAEYIKVLEHVYLYEQTQGVFNDITKRANLHDYEKDKVMVIETSAGPIEVQLYTEIAPKACENFMRLAEKGYYDGLTFHRVIKGFMIQGGDPKGDGTGGESIWGKPFEDEVRKDVQFEKGGILAMANSGPNTNGSQFFITLSPQPNLNMKHTIFGEVITGIDNVVKIGGAATDPANDKPLEAQKILKISLKKWK